MPATTFTKDATTIAFTRAPARPSQRTELLQPEQRSAGGEPVAGAVVAADTTWPLQWRGMSTSELASLISFFNTTVRGMAETFTWTDVTGTARTVRFATPQIDHSEIAYGRFEVSLTLMEA